MTTIESALAISLGAAIGANLRWVLSTWLNAVLPHLPLGTLAADLLGAFPIGIGIALFATYPRYPFFCGFFSSRVSSVRSPRFRLSRLRSSVNCRRTAGHGVSPVSWCTWWGRF